MGKNRLNTKQNNVCVLPKEIVGLNLTTFSGYLVFLQVGKSVRRLTAGQCKSVSLELGGCSSMLVFDSADLDSAVEGVVDAAWGYAGQVSLFHRVCPDTSLT